MFFFFLPVAPPRRSLTHCGLGRFRQGSGGVFFFCCGPAGSFLVSLKRPGGAAAKKTPRGGVFFFLLRPRADAHSLTAGLGGASPSPGWCFFFLLRPRPDRGGVFFFAVAPPRRSLTHCGLGRFRQGSGWCFFFLLWPRPVFLGNSKKCLVYYIGSKKTRRGHNKKQTPLPAQHSMKGLLCAPPRGLRSDGGEGGERDCELNVEWAGSRGGSSPLCLT